MNKVRLVLMCSGKMEYDFELEMKVPKKEEIITMPLKNNKYLSYRVEIIQHFVEPSGKFKYTMITAFRHK